MIRDYVLVDGRDVTPFVERWDVRHEESSYFRSFRIRLRGWHDFQPGQRWDILVEVETGVVAVLRAGIVPPDAEERRVEVSRDGPAAIEVEGYDWAWMAQRIRPQATIVLARNDAHARQLVAESDGPVGRYIVLRVYTLREAVRELFKMCGLYATVAIPDYEFAGMVVAPTMSPWAAAVDLLRPFEPRVYVRRHCNEVVVVHRADEYVGVGSTITIGRRAVERMTFSVPRRRTVRRCLLEMEAAR